MTKLRIKLVVCVMTVCNVSASLCRFGLLKMCWEEDPELRPSFAQLVDVFSTLLDSTKVRLP